MPNERMYVHDFAPALDAVTLQKKGDDQYMVVDPDPRGSWGTVAYQGDDEGEAVLAIALTSWKHLKRTPEAGNIVLKEMFLSDESPLLLFEQDGKLLVTMVGMGHERFLELGPPNPNRVH